MCASCTGNLQNRSVPMCREAGHTLVRAHDAMQLIVSRLKPAIHESLLMLKDAMTVRAGIKQRVDCTISSLGKFMEELKTKVF